MEWMTEVEGDLVSYPVDPKKINCAMLLRENTGICNY